MHKINTFLRRNCLSTKLFQRVNVTDSDFYEALQFGKDCLQCDFNLKDIKQIMFSIILAQLRKEFKSTSIPTFKARNGCHRMMSEIIVECARHSCSPSGKYDTGPRFKWSHSKDCLLSHRLRQASGYEDLL